MSYVDSSIALWSVIKKKPLVTVRNAHPGDSTSTQENWITSVASLQHTNLLASGQSKSCDSHVCTPDMGSNTFVFESI